MDGPFMTLAMWGPDFCTDYQGCCFLSFFETKTKTTKRRLNWRMHCSFQVVCGLVEVEVGLITRDLLLLPSCPPTPCDSLAIEGCPTPWNAGFSTTERNHRRSRKFFFTCYYPNKECGKYGVFAPKKMGTPHPFVNQFFGEKWFWN